MLRSPVIDALLGSSTILLLFTTVADCEPQPASRSGEMSAAETLENLGAKLKRDDEGRVIEVSLASKKIEADDLRHLAAFPDLMTLNLYETPLTDDGLAHLQKLTALKHLNLGSCRKISDAGVKHLKTLQNLESLNLGFCRKITDEGFSILGRFRKLKTLNLAITNITDDGLKTIAELKDLQHLDLDNTPVTDAGISHLKNAKELRSLRFVGAAVGDAGLEALHGIETLRFLNVTDSLVSAAGIESIEQALPKCRVTGG